MRETLTTALTKPRGTPGALGLAEHHDHFVAKVRLHPLEHLDRVRLDRTVDASKQVCGDGLALSSAPRPAVPLVRAVATTTTTTTAPKCHLTDVQRWTTFVCMDGVPQSMNRCVFKLSQWRTKFLAGCICCNCSLSLDRDNLQLAHRSTKLLPPIDRKMLNVSS